jgi:hypothetical protein
MRATARDSSHKVDPHRQQYEPTKEVGPNPGPLEKIDEMARERDLERESATPKA